MGVAVCWLWCIVFLNTSSSFNFFLQVLDMVCTVIVKALDDRAYPIDEESTTAAVHALAMNSEHHDAMVEHQFIPCLVDRLGTATPNQVKVCGVFLCSVFFIILFFVFVLTRIWDPTFVPRSTLQSPSTVLA